MTRTFLGAIAGATLAVGAATATATAQDAPIVGGAPMLAERTIVENAVNSADHTTLVAAVQAAGLVDTLQGPGPFTVFAPTNAAFDRISDESMAMLMDPANVERLRQVLTCHVVAADAMASAIRGMIADDGGTHAVETVGGCTLQATSDGDAIMLTDENGRVANVTIADVDQANGVIHVVDRVLLPVQ